MDSVGHWISSVPFAHPERVRADVEVLIRNQDLQQSVWTVGVYVSSDKKRQTPCAYLDGNLLVEQAGKQLILLLRIELPLEYPEADFYIIARPPADNDVVSYPFPVLGYILTVELLKVSLCIVFKSLRQIHQQLQHFKTNVLEDMAHPLFYAVEIGDTDAVRGLLSAGDNVINQITQRRDYRGSAVHIAASAGRLDILQQLVAVDALAHIDQKKGCRVVLQCACLYNHLEVVQFLLNHNAKVANGYESVLHTAVQAGHVDIVRVLVAQQPQLLDVEHYTHDFTPMCIAVADGHTAIVQLLLDAGASVQAGNMHLATKLAVRHGFFDALALVIEAGAYSSRLLHYAIQENKDVPVNAVDRLLQLGCNVHYVDVFGHSPLYAAVNMASESSVQKLIEYGADVNLLYPEGVSPLRKAINTRHLPLIRMLVQAGGLATSTPFEEELSLRGMPEWESSVQSVYEVTWSL